MSDPKKITTGLRSGNGNAITKAELDILRQKITDLVSQSPQKAVFIVTNWLNQGKSSAQSKKTG